MSLLVLLLFSVSVFGFIFSAALLVRRKPVAYYFFTGVYLIFNISLFINLLIALGFIQFVPHFYRVVSPLQFLLGPFCYLFTRTTLRPYQKLKLKDSLHFLPFVFSFIGLIPIFLLSAEEKLKLMELSKDFKTAWHLKDAFGLDYVVVLRIKFSIFFIYLFFQWKMILGFIIKATRELKEKNKSLQLWLLFDVSLKSVIGMLVFVSAWMEQAADSASILQIALISIEIIGSAFFLIASPELLKGVIFQYYPTEQSDSISQIDTFIELVDDHDKGDISSEEHRRAMTKIEQYFQLEQPYLKHDFSLSDISKTLGLPMRTISAVIRSSSQTGVPEYINKRRIAYLEQLLTEKPEMLRFSVDALAKQVGFSSRSGFYKAFKKNGYYDSPAQMIEKIKEKVSSKM